MHMKKLLTILLLIAAASVLSAQEKYNQSFMLGGGFNLIKSYTANGKVNDFYGPKIHFEYRKNLTDKVLIGGQVYYRYGNGKNIYTEDESAKLDVNCNLFGAKFIVDETFCPDKKFHPFIGLNAGVANQILTRSDNSRGNYFFLSFGMRAGAMTEHFHLSAGFDGYLLGSEILNRFSRKGSMAKCFAGTVEITVGYIF